MTDATGLRCLIKVYKINDKMSVWNLSPDNMCPCGCRGLCIFGTIKGVAKGVGRRRRRGGTRQYELRPGQPTDDNLKWVEVDNSNILDAEGSRPLWCDLDMCITYRYRTWSNNLLFKAKDFKKKDPYLYLLEAHVTRHLHSSQSVRPSLRRACGLSLSLSLFATDDYDVKARRYIWPWASSLFRRPYFGPSRNFFEECKRKCCRCKG